VRKVIAERMWESLQSTAQLTLNASADARSLLTYRKRLKNSDESLGLQNITINDLILFAVSRTLPLYPEVNALFKEHTIYQYKNVHLAVAVDTPRGLVVPVIRKAQALSLKQISEEAKRLAAGAMDGSVSPDELTGGTFTVTNLGSLGIESFTPILNPPQVGILGVGNINLKPVEIDGNVEFIPRISLSLTINHQAVDGAPGARFLQTLSQRLAEPELLLAL
jgi:pyruvate dehydrogenase E2 component (dihydrolipoamide acetyltransferase)